MCLRFCSLLKIGGKEFKDHTSSDKLTKNAIIFPNSLILGSYFKKKKRKKISGTFGGKKERIKGPLYFHIDFNSFLMH